MSKEPESRQDPATVVCRPGRGGNVPPIEHRFRKGQPSLNPGGRPRGGASISEALQVLVKGGSMPNGEKRTKAWSIAERMLADAEAGDPRAQLLVLERTEGKVPVPAAEPREASQGVVLLPAARLEADAWARLAAATLAKRDEVLPEGNPHPVLPPTDDGKDRRE